MQPRARRSACSRGARWPHLARGFSGPAFACMRESADLAKTEQPRDLGDVQLAVVEIANRQIAPQLLKYLIEVQPFGRKSSRKRPLAHSQIASDVFREHPSMGKQRRDRILNSRAQLGHTSSSTCQRRLTIFQE